MHLAIHYDMYQVISVHYIFTGYSLGTAPNYTVTVTLQLAVCHQSVRLGRTAHKTLLPTTLLMRVYPLSRTRYLIAVETCLFNRCLATSVFVGSTIALYSRYMKFVVTDLSLF
jgi:hypothetical protein